MIMPGQIKMVRDFNLQEAIHNICHHVHEDLMIKLTPSIFRKLFLDDNHNTHRHIHKDHPNRIAWVDKDGVHLPLARVEVLLRDH